MVLSADWDLGQLDGQYINQSYSPSAGSLIPLADGARRQIESAMNGEGGMEQLA